MVLKWGSKKKRMAIVSSPSHGHHHMSSSTSPSRRSYGSASADNRWQRGLVGAATNVFSPLYRPMPMSSSAFPLPSRSSTIIYVSYNYLPSPSPFFSGNGNHCVATNNRHLRLRKRRVAAESCHHSGSCGSSSIEDDGDKDYDPTLDDHCPRLHNGKKKSHGGHGMELVKKLRRRIMDSNSSSKKMVKDQESHSQSRGGPYSLWILEHLEGK